MGNGRKKDTALWMVFVQGVALSLGVYLLVTVLASLLLVKAVLPEAGAFPVLGGGMLPVCLSGGADLYPPVSLGQPAQCPGVCRRFSGSADRRESALLETDLMAGPGRSAAAVRSRRRSAGRCAGRPPQTSERREAGPASPEKGKSPLVKFTKNTDLSSCIWEIAAGLAPQQEGERRRQILGRRRFYVYNILFFFCSESCQGEGCFIMFT